MSSNGSDWDGGWWKGALRRPSPFADERPEGVCVDLLVLHYISLPAGVFEGEAVDRLFMGEQNAGDDPKLKGLRVSAHFFIRRDGSVRQYVDVKRRAWHAGVSDFRGRGPCNPYSVGVELEGTGEKSFEDAQYVSLERLINALCERLPIRWATGHETIAPGRKVDPGPMFDWDRLGRLLPSGVERAEATENSMLARRQTTL